VSANSIGKNIVLSSFGESHGPFVGAVLDGFPSGFELDLQAIQKQLQRRRPGQSALTTSRNESDEVQIISGVFEGKTLGTPITFLIPNTDQKPKDYDVLKDVYRPGHADALWDLKMAHRDYRGGGRSSARITAGWVAAGALAEQYLAQFHSGPIHICAWVQQIHTFKAQVAQTVNREDVDRSAVRCPDTETSSLMENAVLLAKQNGDSLGGVIRCQITGVPAGTGAPVFRKLQAQISHYMLNLNAVKGIYFGEDNLSHERLGSENNDSWTSTNGKLGTASNRAGGIVGGMATGEAITFELYFKPTSTVKKEQKTINKEGNPVIISAEALERTQVEISEIASNTSKIVSAEAPESAQIEEPETASNTKEPRVIMAEGRHDPCVLPRAIPIVESLAALALMDLLLEPPSQLPHS
jgi:chorismate synthase